MEHSAEFATKIREAFAPCSLARWPSPLEAAPTLGAALGLETLWLKREDDAGGNKVRGLEFLLAGQPPSVFVSVGGSGSTHCLALARHARALGHRVALAQFPQPDTAASRAVVAATAAHADSVARAPVRLALPIAVLRAWRAARRLGPRRRWIPGGGALPLAVLGHLLATLELGAQLDGAPPPDAIVVPLGTGGTAAGIALGIAWLGWRTRLIAVRVAPRFVANRWRTLRLAQQAAMLLEAKRLIRRTQHAALRLEIVNGLGPGYGHPSALGERAAEVAGQHGLRLDPTYGAKAFGALLQPATPPLRRVVFWQTFPWP